MAVPRRPLPLAFSLLAGAALAQQAADPDFDTRVARPAYTHTHPRAAIDESHQNFHTRGGRYKPLADLLQSDGYRVAAAPRFDSPSLHAVDLLVISNALGQLVDGPQGPGRMEPAFTPAECDAVRDWVRAGGALLLIADHAPFGEANAILAERFGVEMGKGYVLDPKNFEGNETQIVFSETNRMLGSHAILRGRNASERVRKVLSFTGQSLSVPPDAVALLKLSSSAVEAADSEEAERVMKGETAGRSAQGRAQGIAMRFGKGRVVMLGEAAMFSAQIASFDGQSYKMGMNVAGNDDRRFALNVMHWLSGSLK